MHIPDTEYKAVFYQVLYGKSLSCDETISSSSSSEDSDAYKASTQGTPLSARGNEDSTYPSPVVNADGSISRAVTLLENAISNSNNTHTFVLQDLEGFLNSLTDPELHDVFNYVPSQPARALVAVPQAPLGSATNPIRVRVTPTPIFDSTCYLLRCSDDILRAILLQWDLSDRTLASVATSCARLKQIIYLKLGVPHKLGLPTYKFTKWSKLYSGFDLPWQRAVHKGWTRGYTIEKKMVDVLGQVSVPPRTWTITRDVVNEKGEIVKETTTHSASQSLRAFFVNFFGSKYVRDLIVLVDEKGAVDKVLDWAVWCPFKYGKEPVSFDTLRWTKGTYDKCFGPNVAATFLEEVPPDSEPMEGVEVAKRPRDSEDPDSDNPRTKHLGITGYRKQKK